MGLHEFITPRVISKNPLPFINPCIKIPVQVFFVFWTINGLIIKMGNNKTSSFQPNAIWNKSQPREFRVQFAVSEFNFCLGRINPLHKSSSPKMLKKKNGIQTRKIQYWDLSRTWNSRKGGEKLELILSGNNSESLVSPFIIRIENTEIVNIPIKVQIMSLFESGLRLSFSFIILNVNSCCSFFNRIIAVEKSIIKTNPPFINQAIIGIIPSLEIEKFIPKLVARKSKMLDAIKKSNVLKMLMLYGLWIIMLYKYIFFSVRFLLPFLSPDKRQKTRLAKGWQDLQMTLIGRFCKFQ